MTGGCCQIAHLVCPCANPRCPATSRGTPDATVDLLVDAFRNRRIGDIYETFHPAFRAENGDFSESEFSVAYGKWESDFVADAETLAAATRKMTPGKDGRVLVELEDSSSGAYLPIVLENRPKLRIDTSNQFVAPIDVPIDVHRLVTLKDGKLSLPAEIDLAKVAGLPPEAAAQLKSEDVLRVEFTDCWTVREIDPARCRNIRFLDKLKEYLAK
jgi:hypothetical protein